MRTTILLFDKQRMAFFRLPDVFFRRQNGACAPGRAQNLSGLLQTVSRKAEMWYAYRRNCRRYRRKDA
ncbi:MAG: hypothetical protein IJ175_08580 [Clostridia bacterium]|nr:hypothetical protein [Clostridia bacterium]